MLRLEEDPLLLRGYLLRYPSLDRNLLALIGRFYLTKERQSPIIARRCEPLPLSEEECLTWLVPSRCGQKKLSSTLASEMTLGLQVTAGYFALRLIHIDLFDFILLLQYGLNLYFLFFLDSLTNYLILICIFFN